MNRSDLYDHKNPPKVPTPREQDAACLLCPVSRKACLAGSCMLWDEDWECCSMHAMSLHNQIRTAITDAAVEISGAYREAVK